MAQIVVTLLSMSIVHFQHTNSFHMYFLHYFSSQITGRYFNHNSRDKKIVSGQQNEVANVAWFRLDRMSLRPKAMLVFESSTYAPHIEMLK
jgi:hypothetical protein